MILQGHGELAHIHHITSEVTYRINRKHALRGNFTLCSPNRIGLIYGMLEYSISPNWFFVGDQYNYGNQAEAMRIHYYNFSVAYVVGATRIAANFGKPKREFSASVVYAALYPLLTDSV